MCEDIFQPANKADEKCGTCDAKSSDMYNVCRTSSRECRPYLIKVFQELKDLYGVKETYCSDAEVEAKKSSAMNEKIKSQPQRDKKFVEEERKKFLINSFRKKESCKGKM